MSIVLVVDSEKQLSSGIPWCERLTRLTGKVVHVLIVGVDHRTLAEVARSKITQIPGIDPQRTQTVTVENEVGAVLRQVQSFDGCLMLVMYGSNSADFQRKLFDQSTHQTLWIDSSGPPPKSAEQIYVAFGDPRRVATKAAEQLLGITPAASVWENVHDGAEDLAGDLESAFVSKGVVEDGFVLVGVDESLTSRPAYLAGVKLLERSAKTSFGLVKCGDSLTERAMGKFREWISSPMERTERIELVEALKAGSKPNLEFVGLISASSMLAAFGLMQDSAAVVIGAMLIAPLMTPILGAGLALTQGNRPLFESALLTIVLGFISGLTASILFGWLVLAFQSPEITNEMWARCRPSPLDFCVGLVGGIAASYAQTRLHLSSALAGAAIAAALVPPIATAGLQIAFGSWESSERGIPVIGPLLLVTINVMTIMIGSSFVLWARGMRIEHQHGLRARWSLRTVALLMTLTVTTLIWILHSFR